MQQKHKNSFPVTHNSLVHISLLSCHVVFRGLVVIAISSEGSDTEFDSIPPLELPSTRQRNLTHAQLERDLEKIKIKPKVQKWRRKVYFVL